MGRTLVSANQLVLSGQRKFADFRRTLLLEDQGAFDEAFARVMRFTPAISQASHALPFETVLLAMVVELYKENRALRQYLGWKG